MVEFSLGSSMYATMALREVFKTATDSHYQVPFSLSFVPRMQHSTETFSEPHHIPTMQASLNLKEDKLPTNAASMDVAVDA